MIKGTFAEILLAENYMFDETDYLELDLPVDEAYQLLAEKYGPQQELPFGLAALELKGEKGFHFKSLILSGDSNLKAERRILITDSRFKTKRKRR